MLLLNAFPTIPVKVDAVTTGTALGSILNVMVAGELVPPGFVAVTDIVEVPDAVGVPVIAPVAVLKDSPAGKVPLTSA